MKKLLLFAGLAAATLSFFGCNKQEADLAGNDGKVSIRFVTPDTKTANDGLSTNWVKGDALTVFYAPTGTTEYSENTKFSFADEEAAANGVATGEATLGTGTYDWYAIYPYAAKYATPENKDNECYATIGSSKSGSQTQNGLDSKAHLAGYNYPLVGKGTFAASEKASLQMHQLTTVVAVKVKNTTSAAIHVNSVAVTAPEKLVGGYWINFAGDTPVITPEPDQYVSETANLSVTGDNAIAAGATGTFYLAVRPFNVSNAEMTVKVIADEGSVEKKKNVTAYFQAGHIKTLNVDFDDASGPSEIITATVEEFLAASVSETQWYQLSGTVSNITNTTYGNFDLTDETGTVYVYGLTATKVNKNDKTFAQLGIQVGDKITIVSLRSEHNGTAQAGGNIPAYFISKEGSEALFDVEKSSFEVSAETTSVTIHVTGNVAWTAKGSDGTTLDKTSGEGEGNIKVSFAANTDSQNTKEYTVFVRTDNPDVDNDEIEVDITQAKADASGAKTLSMTMTEYVDNNGCTVSTGGSEVMYKTLQLNGSVRMSTTGDDNCGSFWVTSASNPAKQWRLYQNKGGNVTVSVAEGCELQSVKLTFATSNNGILLDAAGTSVANNETRTVSGASVTYTVGNSSETATNGQIRITGVEVVYTGDGTTFPDQPSGPTETTTSISMPSNLSVYVGETVALNATSNVDATITYESEDTAIATVDASGIVTGVAEGTVKVYARIEGVEGEYTDASRYCTVSVTTRPEETEGSEVIIFSELGYADAADVTTVTGDDFTMVFEKGENKTNAPKYYNNGTNVRIYSNNTVTFTSDKTIAKIEFYCTDKYAVNDGTTFSAGSCTDNVWEGSAKSIVMLNGGTAQIRLTGVKVTFE